MKKIIIMVSAFLVLLSTTAFAMSTKDYDAKTAKGINYYNNGKYYEALDEFTWFKDAHYWELNDGQKRYLDNYIDKTNKKINASSVGMNTFEFDYGMSVGIYFFNNGMFYEAKDAFEDFKSISYSKMNAGQKAYFDDWYNGTLREIEKIENVVEPMSTYEFDAGMKKGIGYYNRGMYQEAADEFEWFLDANVVRMNQGQFDYAYDYLMGALSRGLAWMVAAEADNMIAQWYGYEEAIEYVESFYDIDSIIAENVDSEEFGYEISLDYDAYFGILEEKINDICYKWFSNTGTPLVVLDYGVNYDEYDYPAPWFEVRNISGRRVASYKVSSWCYDYYGYLTDGYGYSGGLNTTMNDVNINNGEKCYEESEGLSMGNYVYTDYISGVEITEVTFSDGTVWYR